MVAGIGSQIDWLVSLNLRLFILEAIQDKNEAKKLYYALRTISFLAFFIVALLPLIAHLFRKRFEKFSFSQAYDLVFVAALIGFIFISRAPGLMAPELNPDEGMFIAAANKLLRNPIFWQSVDGTTSGPLNYYVLLPIKLLGLEIEYASARIVALILITSAIICLYFALIKVYSATIARIAVIPATVTIATVTFFDYTHYSSEHLAIALTSLQLLAICQIFAIRSIASTPGRHRLVALVGLVGGMIPFAKLQALPIDLALIFMLLGVLYFSQTVERKLNRVFFINLSILCVSLLLFPAIVLSLVALFSIWGDFWNSYILNNLSYAGQGMSLSRSLENLPTLALDSDDIRPFFQFSTSLILLGLPLVVAFRTIQMVRSEASGQARSTAQFIGYALLVLLAAVYAVIKPGRNIYHYLLFLIIPISFLLGCLLGEISNLRRWQTAQFSTKPIAIFLTSLLFFGFSCHQVFQPNHHMSRITEYRSRYPSRLAQAILKQGQPGDYMAVWGWAPSLYVQTGLLMATRDTHTERQLERSQLQPYYLDRFVQDLQASKPALLIDAVAPGMFRYQKPGVQGIAAFPEVAKVVAAQFQLVDEVERVKIYRRISNTN